QSRHLGVGGHSQVLHRSPVGADHLRHIAGVVQAEDLGLVLRVLQDRPELELSAPHSEYGDDVQYFHCSPVGMCSARRCASPKDAAGWCFPDVELHMALATTPMVRRMITMSHHSDQYSMYWLSNRARSGIEVSPCRPLTWAQPVIPPRIRCRSL